jgi:transposase InsO family protein
VLFPVVYLLHQIKACFAAYLQRWGDWLDPGPSGSHGRRKLIPDTEPKFRVINTPKPPWVREELLRMKAQMPEASCRYLAATFNRRFRAERQMSIGKTYVAETLKQHSYEVQVLRTDLKRRPPRPVPMQHIWGLDLTGKGDCQGHTHTMLGIVEHASRANLALCVLKDKTVLTLLEQLITVMRCYGKPRKIRTDNEPLFQAKRFQIVLWLLNIKHQTTEPGCPWMNGRIERFFGTLKEKLDGWEVDSHEQLESALGLFRVWYNHIRPHQHLHGRTPAEVWSGIDCYAKPPHQSELVVAWDGLLVGYYLRY